MTHWTSDQRNGLGSTWAVKFTGRSWIVLKDGLEVKGGLASKAKAKEWADLRITEGSLGV